MASRIDELARSLLQTGYTDNEPDARLAAVLILLVDEARRPDPSSAETPEADPPDIADT